MDRLFVSSKQEVSAPVFGLRYLEEEAAEINSVVGCLVPADEGGDNGPTYYTTNCDYLDYD